jgi:histidinol-phosphate aminotransferase
MATPKPRPGILDIAPYVPGSARAAPGIDKVYKLSSNESALGSSPKAIEAFRREAAQLFLYPNGAATALREKLGEKHGLDASRIVCGAGSDELLQLICRAYVGPGDNVVQTEYGFLVYALATKACGGEIRFAKEKNYAADVDAILKLVDARTRIVFLANPNNPTGTYIPDSEVRRLREGLREDVLLVLDSAYAEYMEEADYSAGADLVDECDNVAMVRTFSKIYGLAALRVGWGYFPVPVADVINRVRGPFNVATPAIAAGIAALGDDDFVAKNRAFNRGERQWLAQQLGDLGLSFVPGFGNFLLVRFPSEPGKTAPEVQEFLRAHGVNVREMGAYKLGDHLRISVGPKEANRRLVELLAEALKVQ